MLSKDDIEYLLGLAPLMRRRWKRKRTPTKDKDKLRRAALARKLLREKRVQKLPPFTPPKRKTRRGHPRGMQTYMTPSRVVYRLNAQIRPLPGWVAGSNFSFLSPEKQARLRAGAMKALAHATAAKKSRKTSRRRQTGNYRTIEEIPGEDFKLLVREAAEKGRDTLPSVFD